MFNIFGKGKTDKKVPVEKVLDTLSEYNPRTTNCSLVKTAQGMDVNESFGRAFLFKFGEDLYKDDQSIYITTPDDIKAESGYQIDRGHILNLWFLHNRVPHTLNCQVLGRIRFPKEVQLNLDPRLPAAFKLRPVGLVQKSDKRSHLRFSHKVGLGAMKVYSQILFDLYLTKTNIKYPSHGALPPKISDLKVTPFATEDGLPTDPTDVVKFTKNSLRGNPREDRVVYVNKPHMEERTNKVSLVPLGSSSVLGLDAVREGERTLFIKKPMKMSADKKSPNNIGDGDQIILGYHAKSLTDGQMEYFDLVSEVARLGTENMTVRPLETFRQESGLPVELVDFSVSGIKIECSKRLLRYLLGEYLELPFEDRMAILQDNAILLNFYTKLRFNRETEIYRPDIGMKIPIVSKIVRTEEKPSEEGGDPEIKTIGIKFIYDPSEYSRDAFDFDRWELIRDFKENKDFREVHNSLNGLIAYMEAQSR